jgi:hypothetical protein
MPAVQRKTNVNSRGEPYSKGSGSSNGEELEESKMVNEMEQVQAQANATMSPEEEAALNAAAQAATPRRAPPKPRHLPIETLTRDVLKQCLELGEVKDGDRGSKLCFCSFRMDKYCEMTGIEPGSFDLQSSGRGHLTTMTPLMKMPFGLSNTFLDEKTQRPKWTVSFSFYNPENKAEIANFQHWLSSEFKEALTDLLAERARDFDPTIPADEEFRLIKRDMMKNYFSVIRQPKKAEYSPQCSIKIKSMKDSDIPIIKVWDQKTRKTVPYANVHQNDFGQAFIYFEGVSVVGGRYYERWLTQELVYCDPATQQEIATAEDEYPLSVDMSAFAAAAQRTSGSTPSPNPQPSGVTTK